MHSYYPEIAVTISVWALSISLATTLKITVVFSSSAYLDVSVQRVCSSLDVTGLLPAGLPHSDICGSTRVCQSPQLFAAYHVLRRLQEPRHSPNALLYFLLSPILPLLLKQYQRLFSSLICVKEHSEGFGSRRPALFGAPLVLSSTAVSLRYTRSGAAVMFFKVNS